MAQGNALRHNYNHPRHLAKKKHAVFSYSVLFNFRFLINQEP